MREIISFFQYESQKLTPQASVMKSKVTFTRSLFYVKRDFSVSKYKELLDIMKYECLKG